MSCWTSSTMSLFSALQSSLWWGRLTGQLPGLLKRSTCWPLSSLWVNHPMLAVTLTSCFTDSHLADWTFSWLVSSLTTSLADKPFRWLDILLTGGFADNIFSWQDFSLTFRWLVDLLTSRLADKPFRWQRKTTRRLADSFCLWRVILLIDWLE